MLMGTSDCTRKKIIIINEKKNNRHANIIKIISLSNYSIIILSYCFSNSTDGNMKSYLAFDLLLFELLESHTLSSPIRNPYFLLFLY